MVQCQQIGAELAVIALLLLNQGCDAKCGDGFKISAMVENDNLRSSPL